MITFLFSVHTITEAKQYTGLGRAEPGPWIFQPGHLTPPLLSTQKLTNDELNIGVSL